MNYKYTILDFGKVIVKPTTGNWDITPKFLELIDINKIDVDKFKYGNKFIDEVSKDLKIEFPTQIQLVFL